MSLEQYRTFKLAAETANFSKAADKLHLSAAAVGKQIKTLEDTIGAQLFYRTTRRVSLTDFGIVFYEQVCRVLEEYDNTRQLAAAYRGKPAGKLKIFIGSYLGEEYILPNLPVFLRDNPDITLNLELGERIPNLDKEEMDLAIGLMAPYIPEQYVSRRIMMDRYVLCASPAYLKRFGKPKKPEDLSSHHIITHSNRPQPNIIKLKHHTVTVKPSLSLNTVAAMAACCRNGLGIALLPASLLSITRAKKTSLVELLKSDMPPATSVNLYFKKMEYIQPKVRSFIDFALTCFPAEK